MDNRTNIISVRFVKEMNGTWIWTILPVLLAISGNLDRGNTRVKERMYGVHSLSRNTSGAPEKKV